MTIRMLRQYIPLLVIALSIVMSFTPIYSIGVALIISSFVYAPCRIFLVI
jgi:hypothetical protein